MSSSGEYRLSLKVDGVSQATSDFKEFLDAINEGETKISSFSRALDQINVSSLSSDLSDFSGNIDDVVGSFDDLVNSASGISGTMDEISGSLSQIEQDASSARSSLDEVGSSFETVSSNADSAQSSFEGLVSTTGDLSSSMQTTQQDLDSLGPALGEIASETDSAKQAVEELGTVFTTFDVEPAIGGITEFNTLTDTVVNTAQQAEDAINGLVGAASPLGSAFGAAADETEQFTGILANFNNQTEGVSGNIVQAGTSLENLGTQAETAGSKFSLTNNQLVTLAGGLTGLVGAGASVFSMWVQYEQAATRVDAANNKLEQSNIRVDSAQRKYNDAVAQFGASSPQAEEALRRLVLEQDKNAVAADRAGQAQDRFALTMTNIATQALPTFLSAAGSAATIVGTLSAKNAEGVSVIERLKGAAGKAVGDIKNFGSSMAVAGTGASTLGGSMGTLALAIAAGGAAVTAAVLLWPPFVEGMTKAEEQARKTGTALSEMKEKGNPLIDALAAIDEQMRQLHPTEQNLVEEGKKLKDTTEGYTTALEKLRKTNDDVMRDLEERKAALQTEAGILEQQRAGVQAIDTALIQMEEAYIRNTQAAETWNQRLQSGIVLTDNYNDSWATAIRTFQTSVEAIADMAAQLDVTDQLLATGAQQVVDYFEGWNKGREQLQQLESANSNLAGTFDYLSQAIERVKWDNFVKGWNDYRMTLVESIAKTSEMIGTWNSFVDALSEGQGVFENINQGFATGLKSAQDWFNELVAGETQSRGFIAGMNAIADVLNIDIPGGFFASEQAAKTFFENMTGEKLREMVESWEQAGADMIDSFLDGMKKGGDDTQREIERIEKEWQRPLTDPEKWSVRMQVDARNLQEEFDRIETDIRRPLTDEEKWQIQVRAQTEGLTQSIVSGISLGAELAGNDPSKFIEAANRTGTAMLNELTRMAPEVRAAMEPLVAALLSYNPNEPNSWENYLLRIKTALGGMNPELAQTVQSLLPDFVSQAAQAAQQAAGVGQALEAANLSIDAFGRSMGLVKSPVDGAVYALNTGIIPILGPMAQGFDEVGNKITLANVPLGQLQIVTKDAAPWIGTMAKNTSDWAQSTLALAESLKQEVFGKGGTLEQYFDILGGPGGLGTAGTAGLLPKDWAGLHTGGQGITPATPGPKKVDIDIEPAKKSLAELESIATKAFEKIGEAIKTNIVDKLGNIPQDQKISSLGGSLFDAVTGGFANMGQWADDKIITPIYQALTGSEITGIGTKIYNYFTDPATWEQLGQWADDHIWDRLKAIPSEFSTWATDVYNLLTNQETWNALGQWADDNIWDRLKAIPSEFASWAGDVYKLLTSEDTWTNLSQWADDHVWDKLKAIPSEFSTWSQDVYDLLTNADTWEPLQKWVSDNVFKPFKTGIDAIKQYWNSTIAGKALGGQEGGEGELNPNESLFGQLFPNAGTDQNGQLIRVSQGTGGGTAGGGGGGGLFSTLIDVAATAFDVIVAFAQKAAMDVNIALSAIGSVGAGGAGGPLGEGRAGGITPAGPNGAQGFGVFQTLVNQAQGAFDDIQQRAMTAGSTIITNISSGLAAGGAAGGIGGGITPAAGGGGGVGFGAFQILVNQAQSAFADVQSQAGTAANAVATAFSNMGGNAGAGTGGGITPAGPGGGAGFGLFQTLVTQAQTSFTQIVTEAGTAATQVATAFQNIGQAGGAGTQGGITPTGGPGLFTGLVTQAQQAFTQITQAAGDAATGVATAFMNIGQAGGAGTGGGITPTGGAGLFSGLVSQAQQAFAQITEAAGMAANDVATAFMNIGQNAGAGTGGGITPTGGGGIFSGLYTQAQSAFGAIVEEAGRAAQSVAQAFQNMGQYGGAGTGGGITPAGGGGIFNGLYQQALSTFQALVQLAAGTAAAISAAFQSIQFPQLGYSPAPYGGQPLGGGFYGGYVASGFGPQIVDHPMNLTVGESGAEMVFVAPMNNNRNSRTGELSPFAPMRARFQGGTAGGMFPAGGGGMGPGGGIGESFAWMFYQMAEAAMMAGKVTERSMGHITSAVQEQTIPQIEQLGSTFETTGKTSTNALEQIGHMILNGVIPPIEGVGIATIDASNLVGNSTQQMTNSFGHTGSYLQGSFIPLIGQQIPTAGNTAAQGLGQATGNISNSFGQLGSYLNNQFTPTINPAIPNAGNTAAQGIGSASANMQNSFNAANQTVQGLLGSINQIPAAAQQAAGALQGLGAAGGGLGGGLGFGYGTPADYGLTGGFGYGTPADYGLTGGFGYGTPADYGLTGGFGYGDPWAGLGAPTFGLASGLSPMVFNRKTRLTVGESGKELVYRARLQGGTIPAGWNDPNNPLLLLGKKLIAENKPNPTEPFWYTGGTPGGGLASYFPQQQYFPQPGAAIGGPIAGFPTQGGLTQFGQNLPQTPAGTATPEFKAAMQAWFGGTFPTYGLGGTGTGGGGLGGNTFLGSQPATYSGAQGYTPLAPTGAGGGADFFDMFLEMLMTEGEPGMFRFPSMRLQGGTFGPFGSLQNTGSLSGFPTQGGLTPFGQSLFGGGGGYPQQQPTYGGGTYLGQQPAYYGGAQGYQPYPQQQPTGYTGGGFGIGDPWAGVPMPNQGFGIGNPWAGIPSPFPYGGFGPGGYWPGTGVGFPQYPGGPPTQYPIPGGGGGMPPSPFPTPTPIPTPTPTPIPTPGPVPKPPPPPIYSLAPGPGTPRYYPAFRGGEDITSEFFDLSGELPAAEAGLLNSIGSFIGISGVANIGGGTGGGGGGGTGGGTGGGGGGGTGHHRRDDMIREIRRRIERAMGRAGMGSNVLLGAGGMESRMEARLAKIAHILENLTINLTVRNEIDGRAINDAMTKHQVRRLQTFV